MPAASARWQSLANWVDFPDPSVPSMTMSLPFGMAQPFFRFSRAASTRNRGSFAMRPIRLG